MTQKELHQKVIDIHKILVGNGDIGICEQVRENKKDIGYIKSKLQNMPKNWRSWVTFTITVFTFLILIYITYKK